MNGNPEFLDVFFHSLKGLFVDHRSLPLVPDKVPSLCPVVQSGVILGMIVKIL